MDPSLVNPGAWKDIRIILNDTSVQYSVIFGMFHDQPALAMRWNGQPYDRGYPGQANHPLWFVVPDPLERAILDEIATMKTPNINQAALDHARQFLL